MTPTKYSSQYSSWGRPNICMRCKKLQTDEEFNTCNHCFPCLELVTAKWNAFRDWKEAEYKKISDFEQGKDLE
jgi:hypothetical protein